MTADRRQTTRSPLLRRPAALPAADDELVGGLLLPAGLDPLGLPPRGDRVTAAGGLPLAAAQRVVDRVHRDAAHLGALPTPAVGARLADRLLAVVDVPQLPDGGHALAAHHAHLAGGHPQGDVVPLLRH